MEGYGKHSMDAFEFENGSVLNDVNVEFSLSGTPKYDAEGNITNLILYFHGFNGDYSSVNDMFFLTREGGVLDKNDYFIISITSLGLPESCSPSSTGLKHNFPKYTIMDRVNFKRQFIMENFKFKKICGLIGKGLGGYEIFTWACEFPDEMDFIIVASSSYKTNGYRYVVSKGVEGIIDSTDDFYDDVYSESLSKVLISINKVLYSNYFSKKIFQELSNDEIDVLMDDFVDEGLFLDIYDLKFRNDAILEYDVEDKLDRIKAKSLFISTENDIYFTPKFDLDPLKKLVKDSKIVLLNTEFDFGDDYKEYRMAEEDIGNFLKQFKE